MVSTSALIQYFRNNIHKFDWTEKSKENQFYKFDVTCVLASQQPKKETKWGFITK